MNHKRVMAIHDISGYGRCSLTVALPVITAMGVQCCALPAAYLSTHTAFEGFTFHDMTDELRPALVHWKKLGFSFDAIYSGFLGSAEQMAIVKEAKELFPEAVLIVDPVMGDNGVTYKTYTPDMCKNMAKLAMEADVLLPNLTEASIILERSYDDVPKTKETALEWVEKLSWEGRHSVVLKGISLSEGMVGVCWYDAQTKANGFIQLPFYGQGYHGTGDLFGSVFVGSLMNGASIEKAAYRAAEFVGHCADASFKEGMPTHEGVRFEAHMAKLIK